MFRGKTNPLHAQGLDEVVRPKPLFLYSTILSVAVSGIISSLAFLKELQILSPPSPALGYLGWITGWIIPVVLAIFSRKSSRKLAQETPGYFDTLSGQKYEKKIYSLVVVGLIFSLLAIFAASAPFAMRFA